MPGTWSVAANFELAISLMDGMQAVAGNTVNILHARGANVVRDPELEERVSIFGKPTYRDPRPESELIAEAVNVARRADVIVAAMGEAAEMSGESSSLTDLDLPENQRELLKALLETGKPVVLVLFTGRPLSIKWEDENIPAILNVWFAGSEAGYAIADVLFGDVNPSGKLSMTFPQNVGQVPIFYNHKNTGRPLPEGQWFQKFRSNYLDVSNDPLYPFGYGLSYTTFTYDNLQLSQPVINESQTLRITVDVNNMGTFDGEEVVQLYIRDLVGSITRPVKELKGFQKIMLRSGETRQVVFELSEEDLRFYNYDLDFVSESGDFKVFVGGNSRDVLEGEFALEK
jgi:beta-glucosidase